MSDFESELESSLNGLDAGFLAAEQDLKSEVEKASQGVYRITSGLAHLALEKVEEDPDEGVYYELSILSQKTGYDVASFRIAPKGYPIRAARSSASLRRGVYEANFANVDDLRSYFLAMAKSPDSALVLRLAHLRRKPKSIEKVG